MYCYKCGCLLSDKDFCTACGADVGMYKKIVHVSNRLYNDGLEKAQVRDLTGAVISLRQSLKIYKHNIEARNLLGLVYFEMGEAVYALNEWVISKNLRPEKNVADDYIAMLQPNMGQLDSIRQSVKKYNQAYSYCYQDSEDLAIIQLKKVLSMNPKFLRAHLLLALLYINTEQWERALKEISRCLDIDKNNTMALRYLKEVEEATEPEENGRQGYKSKKDNIVRYQSDNEIIIQPVNVKEKKGGGHGFLSLLLGLGIGVAVMYFLVLPASIDEVKNESQRQIAEIGNKMDGKNSSIQELERQISSLKAEKEDLDRKILGYEGEDGTLKILDSLFTAAQNYVDKSDPIMTGEELEEIASNTNVEDMSEAFQSLYSSLLEAVSPDLAEHFYDEGYDAYKDDDYEKAIELLGKSAFYNEEDRNTLYYLAESYRNVDDKENALLYYRKIVELFPGTTQARRSNTYIEELAPENGN